MPSGPRKGANYQLRIALKGQRWFTYSYGNFVTEDHELQSTQCCETRRA